MLNNSRVVKINKLGILFLIFLVIGVGYVVNNLTNPTKTFACGSCTCQDLGPGPREDGGAYGIWCTGSCGGSCGCSFSCSCGNSYDCPACTGSCTTCGCPGQPACPPSCGGGCTSTTYLYDNRNNKCSSLNTNQIIPQSQCTSVGATYSCLGGYVNCTCSGGYCSCPPIGSYSNLVSFKRFDLLGIYDNSVPDLAKLKIAVASGDINCTTLPASGKEAAKCTIPLPTDITVAQLKANPTLGGTVFPKVTTNVGDCCKSIDNNGCSLNPDTFNTCVQGSNSNSFYASKCVYIPKIEHCHGTGGDCDEDCGWCIQDQAPSVSCYENAPCQCSSTSGVGGVPGCSTGTAGSISHLVSIKSCYRTTQTNSCLAEFTAHDQWQRLRNGVCDQNTECFAGVICARPESNSIPPTPSKAYYCVNGTDDAHCTDITTGRTQVNPAVVTPPSVGQQVYILVTNISLSGSGGLLYNVSVDDINTTNDIVGSYRATNKAYDPNTANENLFLTTPAPGHKLGLTGGSLYKVTGLVQSKNVCDSAIKSNPTPVYGYVRIDNPPVVVSVDPTPSISGTETDTDNGPSCFDNNPNTYTVKYTDLDGCADIKQTYLWIDDIAPSTPNMRSAAHGSVIKNGSVYQYRGTKYNAWGLTCPDGSVGQNCYKNYTWNLEKSGENVGPNSTYFSVAGTAATDSSDTIGWQTSGSNASVRAISAVCTGANELTVKYQVAYFGTEANNIGSALKIYSFVEDQAGVRNVDSPVWKNLGSLVLDLKPPSASVTITTPSKTELLVKCDGSDINGIISSYCYPGLLNSTYIAGTKTINTVGGTVISVALPAVSPNILPSPNNSFSNVSFLSSTYSPASTPVTGTVRVNVGTIDNGDLKFIASVTDKACNNGTGMQTQTIGSSWLTTKGGIIFSGGDVNDPVKNYDSTGLLPNTGVYSWGVSPFQNSLPIDKSQTQISTELISTNGTVVNSLINRLVDFYNPYLVKGYSDANNTPAYQRLKDQYSAKLVTDYTEVSVAPSGTISGSTGAAAYCPNVSKKCAILASGNLTVASGFVCDRETVVFVGGNLTINPDVTFSPSPKNGCIFVVRGNVLFADGTNQSNGSTYPKYDLFQLFVVADGQITFERAPATQTISDGIKIDGSVLSFSTATPSVQWLRSLQLKDNDMYPSIAIHLDPRYLFIAPDFFEGNFDAYVKELGFKPF